MPGFDGTGPRGQGPMTGRGDGYCAVVLPTAPGARPYGYAGLQGRPVAGPGTLWWAPRTWLPWPGVARLGWGAWLRPWGRGGFRFGRRW